MYEISESNRILYLTFEFSKQIIQYCKEVETSRQFHIANQLFRSGTSVGANVFEAQSPESKADFIHKMKIASKESYETNYWLLLCKSELKIQNTETMLSKAIEIRKILNSIIGSAKNK